MIREQFLVLLAAFIQQETGLMSKDDLEKCPEPYRHAGDRLVDDALELIP